MLCSQLAYREVQALLSEEVLPMFKAHMEAMRRQGSQGRANKAISLIRAAFKGCRIEWQ